MILDTEKLIEINDSMLLLGAPIEKDNVGYNMPDYALCFNMAYMPAEEITNVMAYAMVDTMCHYKNTQLSDLSDDLEETKRNLMGLITDNESKNYKSLVKHANIAYRPKKGGAVLSFVSYDEESGILTVHHDKYCGAERNFKDENYRLVRFAKEGDSEPAIWNTCVNISIVDEYIPLMSKAGYEMDDALRSFYRSYNQYKETYDEGEEERLEKAKEAERNARTIVLVKRLKAGFEFTFEGYVPELKDYVAMHRDDGVIWKKTNTSFDFVIPYGMYRSFKETFEKAGCFFDKVSFLEEEIEKLEELKKNKYKMIDPESTDLPFKLYDYQIEDIEKAMSTKRALLGHDMGCGKSVMSVMIGESIKIPKLIICPESLRLNWVKEIKNVRKNSDVAILYSNSKEDFEWGKDYTIVGYKTAIKFKDKILDKHFDCVFVDEAHNCKAVNNSGKPASKRAETVIDITLAASYCYILTGTPIPVRNKDIFNILRMLEVDSPYVKSFFKFGLAFCAGYQNGFGWDFTGNSNETMLHDLLSTCMIRRLKKDVLPDLKKQRVFIPMTSKRREYKMIEERLSNLGEGGRENGDTFLSISMEGRKVLSKEKTPIAIDYASSLVEEGRSVVIVSSFNETLDAICERFEDNCCCIRGGMKDAQKQAAIDDFQSGRKQVCAINIKAGGVGVTLTKAHDMIICDYEWQVTDMVQVEDRICRSGQTEPCVISYICCENSTLDNIFISMITANSANIDAVVDGAENQMNLESVSHVDFFEVLASVLKKKSGKEEKKTSSKKPRRSKKTEKTEETLDEPLVFPSETDASKDLTDKAADELAEIEDLDNELTDTR